MAIENIVFPAAADYLNLPAATYNFKATPAGASDYDVVITPTGTTIEAIKATLNFENGGIYTAIARDGVDLTMPLSVIGLDGLAPQ